MAFTFPAMVAWDPHVKAVVKNSIFQAYTMADTGFIAPLAITDTFGNPLAGNYLNTDTLGVFPQFMQAVNSTVVLSDSAHIYAWTVNCVPSDASFAGFVTAPGSQTGAAVAGISAALSVVFGG